MKLAWWRWETPPPRSSCIKNLFSEAGYAANSQNFEKLWCKTGAIEKVNISRSKCEGFGLAINRPGSIEWVIKNWEAVWDPKGLAENPDFSERLLVAEYLEKKGLSYALSLLDNDRITCAIGCLVHRNDLVIQYIYGNREYKNYLAPIRLIDLAFHWAKDKGFNRIDVGGPISFFKKTSFGAKEKWAPEYGQKYTFSVCPINISMKKRLQIYFKMPMRK